MEKSQMNQEKRIEDCQCETCGSKFKGEVVVYTIAGRPREHRPWECPPCKEKRQAEAEKERQEYLVGARQEQREQWRQRSGIPEGLITRTFDNFEPGWQDKALKVCRKYAQGFSVEEAKGYRSLILYSAVPGVGKTHLMVAIANSIIDSWNGEPWQISMPIRLESGPGLVRRIRATYSLRRDDVEHEREEDIYRELRGVRLLLLDDVGKEKPSDFTRELYWYIINERVTSGLPVVMTCRLPLEGKPSLKELMTEDTVNRLYGMAHGHVEVLEGESYRTVKKVA
jgi:DNA replication protein DnaC